LLIYCCGRKTDKSCSSGGNSREPLIDVSFPSSFFLPQIHSSSPLTKLIGISDFLQWEHKKRIKEMKKNKNERRREAHMEWKTKREKKRKEKKSAKHEKVKW